MLARKGERKNKRERTRKLDASDSPGLAIQEACHTHNLAIVLHFDLKSGHLGHQRLLLLLQGLDEEKEKGK